MPFRTPCCCFSCNVSSRGRGLSGKILEKVCVRLELLLDNVKSTHQFAISVQLWKGRPIRELLQALTNIVVGKDVEEAWFVVSCVKTRTLRVHVPYLTWFSRSKLTNCLLNPHCGAEGVPFMKSMTLT